MTCFCIGKSTNEALEYFIGRGESGICREENVPIFLRVSNNYGKLIVSEIHGQSRIIDAQEGKTKISIRPSNVVSIEVSSPWETGDSFNT
jgi:hypothetical protein